MVTSSAVVGSSAISSFGLSAMADGDDHALALAAATVRADSGQREAFAPAGRRGRASARAASSRLARGSACVCQRMSSATCSPMVFTGFSAVIGSWNTMPMSSPRRCAHLALGSLRAGRRRRSVIAPAGARAVGQQLHDRQRRHRLAGAGFADQPEHLAGVDGEVDAAAGSACRRWRATGPRSRAGSSAAPPQARVEACRAGRRRAG